MEEREKSELDRLRKIVECIDPRILQKTENALSKDGLTQEQIKFLNTHTIGEWEFDHDTGLVDVWGSFNMSYGDYKNFQGIKFGYVFGFFDCSHNKITSLVGAPKEVRSSFLCDATQITSLKGAPKKLGGTFYCRCTNLTSLEGAPKKFGESSWFGSNPVSIRTIRIILDQMEEGLSYVEAVEYIWSDIPEEDQALLYRPKFKWVKAKN